MAFMDHLKAVAETLKGALAPTVAKAPDAVRDDGLVFYGGDWINPKDEARRNWESLYVDTSESDAPPPALDRVDAVLNTTRQAWQLTPEEIDSIGREDGTPRGVERGAGASGEHQREMARARAVSRKPVGLER
jgi:hypothetical protein